MGIVRAPDSDMVEGFEVSLPGMSKYRIRMCAHLRVVIESHPMNINLIL